MTTPGILGRSAGDGPEAADCRAPTTLCGEVQVPYVGGAIGTARVEVFRSDDSEDRGGVVLRLTIANESSSLVPTFRVVENGIELHIAGDAEAIAMLSALAAAVQMAREAAIHPVHPLAPR